MFTQQHMIRTRVLLIESSKFLPLDGATSTTTMTTTTNMKSSTFVVVNFVLYCVVIVCVCRLSFVVCRLSFVVCRLSFVVCRLSFVLTDRTIVFKQSLPESVRRSYLQVSVNYIVLMKILKRNIC